MSQTSARPRLQLDPPVRADPAAAVPTLWEEGHRPGRQVASVSVLAAATVAGTNVALTGRLSLFFDLTFVVLCLVAALAVRPRDFFVVGVLPPLLMLATISLLAVMDRGAVADEVDGIIQAVVSGLAHHAGGLLAGHAVALAILGLRQVALRNAARLRTMA